MGNEYCSLNNNLSSGMPASYRAVININNSKILEGELPKIKNLFTKAGLHDLLRKIINAEEITSDDISYANDAIYNAYTNGKINKEEREYLHTTCSKIHILAKNEYRKSNYPTQVCVNIASQVPDNTEVLFVGENHLMTHSAEISKNMLSTLKEKGYYHLALEIEDRYQAEINKIIQDYKNGSLNKQQLRKEIEKFLYHSLFDEQEKGLSNLSDRYVNAVDMVVEAINMGYDIICADHSDNSDGKTRDEIMAVNINNALGKGGKLIYLVGSSHALKVINSKKQGEIGQLIYRMTDTNEISTRIWLERSNRKCYTIKLCDKDDPNGNNPAYYWASKDVGSEADLFFVTW